MTTQNEIEEKYDHVYYFKINENNPLMLSETGDAIQLENMTLEVQGTGQIELDGEKHGFIGGHETQ